MTLRTEGKCGHGPDEYRRGANGIPRCNACRRLSLTAKRRAAGITGHRRMAGSAREAFDAKTAGLAGSDGCWVWPGAKTAKGYGVLSYQGPNGRVERVASRVALELVLGRPLEPEEYACHHCDNPPCVNPAHLFLGSALANARDASRKGRMALGERNARFRNRFAGMARPALTEPRIAIVRLALAEGYPGSEIARFLGVSQAAVSRIRNGTRHGRAAA